MLHELVGPLHRKGRNKAEQRTRALLGVDPLPGGPEDVRPLGGTTAQDVAQAMELEASHIHGSLQWMRARNMVREGVIRDQVAAISCGLYGGEPVLDLDYAEDSEAETDANFVMTGAGGIVEVQGTAETEHFSQEQFDALMVLARKGIAELVELQKLTVG